MDLTPVAVRTLTALLGTALLATAPPGVGVPADRAAANCDGLKVESPRLLRLKAGLAAGDRTALEHFWRRVAAEGTPLVEPVSMDSTCLLVTFLFRDSTANSVTLASAFAAWLGSLARLERLPQTDLWHRTVSLHASAQVSYRFRVETDAIAGAPVSASSPPRFVMDALNARVDSALGVRSAFVGPAAPGLRWTAPRAGVSHGRTVRAQLPMRGRDTAQTVWVYTPPGYDSSSGTLPLLVLFDGGAYVADGIVGTPLLLDNLIADSLVTPLIVLFLPQELTPSARQASMGNNSDYIRFVAEEAIPWVQSRDRVTRDPRRIVVGGSSLGGLAASHLALRYPNVVGNVLSQSGAYQWSAPRDREPEWLTRQFILEPRQPTRFYLEVGRFEIGAPADGVSLVEANRRFRDVLLSKGYELTYREIEGGHEYLSWRATLAEALPLFFSPR